MTIDEFHTALARDMLGPQPSDDDALTLMILLHTHHIWLPRAPFSDRPGVADLSAITRWHAAEAVAAAWPDRSNSLRADADYWHEEFGARTPYEVIEDIPVPWIERVEKLKKNILRHPLVQRLEPED
jgi:hypothetical protein